MQFTIRASAFVAAAALAAGLVMTSTACSSAPPAPSGTPTASTPALAYMESPARAAEFQQIAPKAGVVIAKALEAGRFGSVKRYDTYKFTLKKGEFGWGDIEATSGSAFAWVYWNANGTIDYSKGVPNFAISDTSENLATYVSIDAPENSAAVNNYLSYWTESYALSANTFETNDLAGSPRTSMFWSPTDVSDLKLLDAETLYRLQYNMAEHFGQNWN